MEDINIALEIDVESSKKIVDKFKQESEDSYKRIQQHFEECWQATLDNKIQVDENTSEEAILFAKSVFLYGCNVGWNDCYTFHEHLIQKGLNQQ